jgi:stage V sporulation protein S
MQHASAPNDVRVGVLRCLAHEFRDLAAAEFIMDRFFSKLDLRDIKIDPEKSRFSPDEEFIAEDSHQEISVQPAWTPPVAHSNGFESGETMAASSEQTETFTRSDDYSDISDDGIDVLKVSSKSRPSAVAGAIAGVVRELGRAEVQAIGAGATNQAIKAVAIARDYLSETGIDVVCLPAFIDITIDNEDRTAIRLVIEPR